MLSTSITLSVSYTLAASVSLAGGHQISQILVKVLDVPVCLVSDVGINLWSRCISNVAAVWEESRVGG